MQTNTNNINKTWALLQTTGGKDEPNIVFMWKSSFFLRTSNGNTTSKLKDAQMLLREISWTKVFDDSTSSVQYFSCIQDDN